MSIQTTQNTAEAGRSTSIEDNTFARIDRWQKRVEKKGREYTNLMKQVRHESDDRKRDILIKTAETVFADRKAAKRKVEELSRGV